MTRHSMPRGLRLPAAPSAVLVLAALVPVGCGAGPDDAGSGALPRLFPAFPHDIHLPEGVVIDPDSDRRPRTSTQVGDATTWTKVTWGVERPVELRLVSSGPPWEVVGRERPGPDADSVTFAWLNTGVGVPSPAPSGSVLLVVAVYADGERHAASTMW